jgi:hypothetical protein
MPRSAFLRFYNASLRIPNYILHFRNHSNLHNTWTDNAQLDIVRVVRAHRRTIQLSIHKDPSIPWGNLFLEGQLGFLTTLVR